MTAESRPLPPWQDALDARQWRHLTEHDDSRPRPPGPRFARPAWFDEPSPEVMARPRTGLARGGIRNGREKR